MARAGGTHVIAPDGTGVDLPVHSAGSKDHSLMIPAWELGRMAAAIPTYFCHISASALDSGPKNICDIFNADAVPLRFTGIWVIVRQDVGVTWGTTPNSEKSVRIDWSRTSSEGTLPANTAVFETTSNSGFTRKDADNPVLPAGVTARELTTSSGGATATEYLYTSYHALEEFGQVSARHAGLSQFYNLLPAIARGRQELWVPENTGLKAAQANDLSASLTTGGAIHTLFQFERLSV